MARHERLWPVWRLRRRVRQRPQVPGRSGTSDSRGPVSVPHLRSRANPPSTKPQESEPDNFESWENLLKSCEALEGGLSRNSSPQALAAFRDAYDRFLAKFPLFFGYWKKYAELEFNIAGTESAEMVGTPVARGRISALTTITPRSTSGAAPASLTRSTCGPSTVASRWTQPTTPKSCEGKLLDGFSLPVTRSHHGSIPPRGSPVVASSPISVNLTRQPRTCVMVRYALAGPILPGCSLMIARQALLMPRLLLHSCLSSYHRTPPPRRTLGDLGSWSLLPRSHDPLSCTDPPTPILSPSVFWLWANRC